MRGKFKLLRVSGGASEEIPGNEIPGRSWKVMKGRLAEYRTARLESELASG